VNALAQRWSARIVRWLKLPGVFAWRFLTGKELDGVPRTDATWMARGTAALDPDKAPRALARLAFIAPGDPLVSSRAGLACGQADACSPAVRHGRRLVRLESERHAEQINLQHKSVLIFDSLGHAR
jgi:hypothetical protein